VSEIEHFGTFGNYLRAKASEIFRRAETHCKTTIRKAKEVADKYFQETKLDSKTICLACVGSVGRQEALECSDLDLVPIISDDESLKAYDPHDQELRRVLAANLGIKVSKGEDLTKPISLSELTDPDTIGGTKDDSGTLTKRMLILTEGKQITGDILLSEVRHKILHSYSNAERTSGRHVLSLCNDIARYYRTLCIEYKAKVDVEDKDWCTRNMKLRHSRKLWYFSNIISISHLADGNPIQTERFAQSLCDLFELPPCARLLSALSTSHPIEVGNLLEHFSYFMDFMSGPENRAALAKVDHATRYDATMNNPFPAVKFNSDALHNCMMSILNGLEPPRRKVVFDWFLM
jgi:hypothetical protein